MCARRILPILLLLGLLPGGVGRSQDVHVLPHDRPSGQVWGTCLAWSVVPLGSWRSDLPRAASAKLPRKLERTAGQAVVEVVGSMEDVNREFRSLIRTTYVPQLARAFASGVSGSTTRMALAHLMSNPATPWVQAPMAGVYYQAMAPEEFWTKGTGGDAWRLKVSASQERLMGTSGR